RGAQLGPPAVLDEEVRTRRSGVEVVEEAHAPVAVAVDTGLEVVARQELRVAERTRLRAAQLERIDTESVRHGKGRPHLGIEGRLEVAGACRDARGIHRAGE